MKDLERDLQRELEEGTYFLHPLPVFEKIEKTLQLRAKASGWDPDFDGVLLGLLAGLSVFDRAYSQKLEGLLRDPSFSHASKVKALNVIRQHFIDPDHSAPCLDLYGFFLEAPGPVKDFAARSLLQLMTEMRVGGQVDLILAKDSNREKITGILATLSEQGWLEAAELLDLLELNF